MGAKKKQIKNRVPKLIDLEVMKQEARLKKLQPTLVGLEMMEGTVMALSIVPGISGHPVEIELNGPDLNVTTFEFDDCIDYSILPSIPVDSRIILAAASEGSNGYLDNYVASIATIMAACLGELKVELIEPDHAQAVFEYPVVRFTFVIGQKEFFTSVHLCEVEQYLIPLTKAE